MRLTREVEGKLLLLLAALEAKPLLSMRAAQTRLSCSMRTMSLVITTIRRKLVEDKQLLLSLRKRELLRMGRPSRRRRQLRLPRL